MRQTGRWRWLGAALVVALVVLPVLAEARVGGGQSFGRSSGGGGGSSGGGGGGELLLLLIQLCIQFPALGIPVVIGVVVLVVVRGLATSNTGSRMVLRTDAPRGKLGIPGLAELKQRDGGFSRTVLVDFLVLLHRRAHEAISNGQWDALRPFLTEDAQRELLAAHGGVAEVSELVVGGVRLIRVDRRGTFDLLTVVFETTQLERIASGSERRSDVKERWVFRRAAGVTSVAPERVEALGCPNCGSPIEVTPMGTCRSCDTPITAGQLQWQAAAVKLESRRQASVPEVGWVQGGDEASVHVPTLEDPGFSASLRSLKARHPEFETKAFVARVNLVYLRLQAAWSAGRWEGARPYVTDPMFQTLRFWVDRYTRNHLRNRLEDVVLERVAVVQVEVDAWYESITVRLWGSMKDAIVDQSGTVIGGNPKVDRRFSEYWTFLRAAGTDGSTKGDQDRCPSCGAPLDRVDPAGICGYCDAKITGGRFDWVLSRIDQPEAYTG